MMRKEKKYLFDILSCIELIEEYVSGCTSLEEFEKDMLTRDAVERRFIIISEAGRRLKKLGFWMESMDSIINRRNTIVHQYDQFQLGSVWRSIQNELPDLKTEVQSLLSD